MPGWIVPVILVDLVITAIVLWVVFRRRFEGPSLMGSVLKVDFRSLRQFSDAVHPRIGEYVRANWSGMSDQLPGVLKNLLDEIEREARSRSLALDRETLKLVLLRSLASHGIGRGAEVRQALEEVA